MAREAMPDWRESLTAFRLYLINAVIGGALLIGAVFAVNKLWPS